MKFNLTPEQRQTTEERRKKFVALVKQVADLSDEQRAALAAKILVRTVEGHMLSVTNQMLVALQFENPTFVGGFQQWRKAGRCVRKGEHGICIWIPKEKKEDPNKKPGEISSNEHPNFFMGTVFDISQTEEAVK